MKRSKASWFWTVVLTVGAAWLSWIAAVDLLLLAAGKEAPAVAEYSIASRGARNRTYEVHYVLFRDGKEYRGSGSASRALAAGSRVPVRVLSLAPSINSADSTTTLTLRGLCSLALGVALAVVAWRRFSAGSPK